MATQEKFIGYTLGLDCWVGDKLLLTKVEYSQRGDNVVLRAVSGRNLAPLQSNTRYEKVISQAEFDSRPTDPYDDAQQAVWAMELVGLRPAALN